MNTQDFITSIRNAMSNIERSSAQSECLQSHNSLRTLASITDEAFRLVQNYVEETANLSPIERTATFRPNAHMTLSSFPHS